MNLIVLLVGNHDVELRVLRNFVVKIGAEVLFQKKTMAVGLQIKCAPCGRADREGMLHGVRVLLARA